MQNYSVLLRDGKKTSLVTFDFLKFSKQLIKRKLCGDFQKSPEKVTGFISVKILSLLCLLVFSHTMVAQNEYQVHSHNDYEQKIPFWYAYSNGAASIEVDLFLKNDTLFVTHAEEEITADKTFERLYLQPLETLADAAELEQLQLLIDIKSEAYSTLDSVIAKLEDYPMLLQEKNLMFVISGNRPAIKDYPDYPDFISFDHQNLMDLEEVDLRKVALISQRFKDYSGWNGYGRMTSSDLTKVVSAVRKAKETGKPFRFWATPDTKTAWNAFVQLGVDYINTDKPGPARIFLDKLDQNSYTEEKEREVYLPAYAMDQSSRPKNIILMIGDGNGLAQISAAMIANQGQLSLTNIKDIGLVKTSSADDLVTDSAAGGTAMATGTKANNRAIGVDPGGKNCRNLIEILSDNGYNTAIITTDAISGATPAAFYAHTHERDDTDAILEDLKQSGVDFFISGGQAREDVLSEVFVTKTVEEFEDFDQPTAVYFGDNKMPSVKNGREDFLPMMTTKALHLLSNEEAPFFLVIEGAQIDNGGHDNDISTIINEMLDFDQVIGEALQFADLDKNTLIIITADHETGGLGIAGGDTSKGMVRADFLSVDHSGIMVPLFAYGPQSQEFRGFFENTLIFTKILAALGISKNK
jgi:alkaline phosphatase